jgi:hypothetical protein
VVSAEDVAPEDVVDIVVDGEAVVPITPHENKSSKTVMDQRTILLHSNHNLLRKLNHQ